MTRPTKNSFRNYNSLIDNGLRRAHIERSKAFYDLWSQMTTRFNKGNGMSEG
ncbi:MAG: hypothetical protein AAFO73_00495 [Pseudomonadota bacterium]